MVMWRYCYAISVCNSLQHIQAHLEYISLAIVPQSIQLYIVPFQSFTLFDVVDVPSPMRRLHPLKAALDVVKDLEAGVHIRGTYLEILTPTRVLYHASCTSNYPRIC